MSSRLSDKRPQFFMVEDAVFNFNLTPYEGWVYMAILKHADRQTGIAFPGITLLSKLTNMSRDQVMRAIKALESKGIISVKRDTKPQKGEKRQRSVNHYEVKQLSKSEAHELGGVVAGSDYGSSSEQLGVVAGSDLNQNHINQNQRSRKLRVKNPSDGDSKKPKSSIGGVKSLPDQLIDVWAHETKAMVNNLYQWRWAAKLLLELNPPATVGEVETLCRLKMVDRKTEYEFRYLLDDIPKRRKQLAEQAKEAEQKAVVNARGEEERRRNRILWGWETDEETAVDNAS